MTRSECDSTSFAERREGVTAGSKIETRHGTGATAGENMFSGVQLLVQPGPPECLGSSTIGLGGPMVKGPGTGGSCGVEGAASWADWFGQWAQVY